MTAPEGALGQVFVWAPAKINLALEVLGRRPDGYHELATIFQAIGLADRVELTLLRDPEVTLEVRPSGLDLGPVEENLALRAARALLQEIERRSAKSGGVRIRLTKRIPAGAGLGGGASDAAATLVGLARLLQRSGVPTPELPPIALGLGADVPFFLEGGTRFGTGVGEILRPIPPWPAKHVTLVFPNVGVSTSSVFRRWESGLTLPGPLASMAGLGIPSGFWRTVRGDLRNDLQAIVAERHPVILEVLEEFRRLGSGFARMSGSGSAVFGVAEDGAQAREWAESFRARGFWARAVRPTRGGCRIREAGSGGSGAVHRTEP